MSLAPRYGGSPVIAIAGSPDDQLIPFVRQRRRLEQLLGELSHEEWGCPSRCAGWTTQDVAAHLVGVNRFWAASVRAGLAGQPTQVLANFDPVVTPERMVAETRGSTPDSIFSQFAASNDELVDLLVGLDAREWAATAEAPPGHLPIRLLAGHALWDAWIHERDIGLPLSRVQPLHDDEVVSCLRYVCALTSAIVVLAGGEVAGSYGVTARSPELSFSLEITESVAVREGAPASGAAVLRGDAVTLVEAMSTRVPFETSVPAGWEALIDGLGTVFTARPTL